MRIPVALSLLGLLPAFAIAETTESLASRFPAGAIAYVEVHGLAGAVDALLDSPLGKKARENPLAAAFWEGPQGRKLATAESVLKTLTGYDLRGALRAFAGRELALAAYPGPKGPPTYVVATRLSPEAAPKAQAFLAAAGLFARAQAPPEEGRPLLFDFGGSLFSFVDGDLWVSGTDRARVVALRDGGGEMLGASEWFAGARGLLDAGVDAFALLDLRPFAEKLRAGAKAKDLGQALFLGALPAYLPDAPYAALALTARGGALDVAARIPAPKGVPAEVATCFGGELAPLPFALPERTVALLRFRRDLRAIWEHRDALLAEAGVAQTIEFETNFGTLTAGMSFVDDFLPRLGPEVTILATRAEYAAGVPAPSVRLPQFALLFPMKDAETMWPELRQAFLQTMSLVNLGAMQSQGRAFRIGAETHKGVEIQTATYRPPEPAEMEGQTGLPIRYNFSPSAAMVHGCFVIGSTTGIVREIVDAQGRPGTPAQGVNAGFWIEGRDSAQLLRENREAFVSQAMLEEGKPRATAEMQLDLALEIARHVLAASLVVEEGRDAVGLRLHVAFDAQGN